MKTMTLKVALTMVMMGLVMFEAIGCSDVVVERLENVAAALKGNVEEVPSVVSRQRRQERIRQNSKWTLENQARYPIEYCQAQLKELTWYATKLSEQAHEYAVAKSQTSRIIIDSEAQIKTYDDFLSKAKTAYREAEKVNQWPMVVNGFSLSKKKAQEKIVDAVQKKSKLECTLLQRKNLLVLLENRLERVYSEQQNVTQIRERIQNTLMDLKLKKVIKADQEIVNVLDAINDSLNALGANDEGIPSVEALTLRSQIDRDTMFDAIMAE